VTPLERDPYCRRILARHWATADRTVTDVTDANASNLAPVDLICGGFPCQDLSVAGLGAGLDGAKSGLWFHYLRIVRDLRPRFVVVENVPALVVRGLDVVLGGLAELGYDAEWGVLSAAAVGAPHLRRRLFVIAYLPDAGRVEERDERGRVSGPRGAGAAEPRHDGEQGAVADADGLRELQQGGAVEVERRRAGNGGGEIAVAESARERRDAGTGAAQGPNEAGQPRNGREDAPDADLQRREEQRGSLAARAQLAAAERYRWWAAEPGVGRVAHGIPARVHRLRTLGNAVVPQVAYEVGLRLREMIAGGREFRHRYRV